jgi:uncharacterized membrane protein
MVRLGAILLGVGLGGFVDGIVLHQILQWHHMLSHVEEVSTVSGLQVNTLADGLFHVLAWACVAAGTLLLVLRWRAGQRPPAPAALGGLVLAGWGGFNLVEGLVNHHILGIHHVRDDVGAPVAWDVGFLLVAVVQIAVGVLIYRRTTPAAAEPALR